MFSKADRADGVGRAGVPRLLKVAFAFAALLSAAVVKAAPIVDHALPELHDLQQLAGRDPDSARARIQSMRSRALEQGDMARRLALDELDCLILSDENATDARAVAAAGASAAALASPQSRDVALASLRLAACGASALLDMGSTREGDDELDHLIALTGPVPALEQALGVALMVQGQHRSRRGELILGQDELLRACSILRDHGREGDSELCDWYLVNHYKRTGDYEESLAIANRLLVAARHDGRTADEGVYVYGIAQVHYAQQKWADALREFNDSLRIALAAKDLNGQAYTEQNLAGTLWHLSRGQEALQHLDVEDRLLVQVQDSLQSLRSALLRTKVLCDLAHPDAALQILESKRADLERSRDDSLRVDWLQTRARALSLLGRSREAYAELLAATELDGKLTKQALSKQAASWRMQFNRERDTEELTRLRAQTLQAEQLHRTESLAIALGVGLLIVVGALAVNRVVQARRLHQLAMRDELTGLANRRASLQRMDVGLRQARRLGHSVHVLMIDVDHFKRINDTHGHGVGDEVLRELANQMVQSLRSHDWVGRLGGEEFVAMLTSATAPQAVSIAERMRSTIAARPFVTSVGPLAVTISIGLVSSNAAAQASQELIDAADALLYEAKRDGRNLIRTKAV
jgi:diguanylate cyclase (GGDEF)-like protein